MNKFLTMILAVAAASTAMAQTSPPFSPVTTDIVAPKGNAGYVIDATGRRWIVAAIVNHPNAARSQAALDRLIHWTYRSAATYSASGTIH